MPRRGNPGLARGPVAVERGSLLLPASVAAPWAGRPLHGYAALGCAGRVVGWREMPLHWHLSPWRRGTPGAQLIGTHSRIPRGACAFLSASRVDTSILLSPPPSPSPLTPADGTLLSAISQPGDAGCSRGSAVRKTLCILGSLCVGGSDGVHLCLLSLQSHKGRAFPCRSLRN